MLPIESHRDLQADLIIASDPVLQAQARMMQSELVRIATAKAQFLSDAAERDGQSRFLGDAAFLVVYNDSNIDNVANEFGIQKKQLVAACSYLYHEVRKSFWAVQA